MKMIEPTLERICDAEDFLGETPVWSVEEQALYWINCEKPSRIARFNSTTGEYNSWPMPERIGAIALKKNGGLLAALASGIFDFDPATGTLHKRAPSGLPDNFALHEGKCDRQGRFWIGSLDRSYNFGAGSGGGAFQRLEGNRLVPQIRGITVANGLAWSPNGATLYHTDMPDKIVMAYDYDQASGTASNGRAFIKLDDDMGVPDGAAVDAEGGYWTAIFMSGCLRRYLPDGTLEREIRLPFSRPTMPVFGGPKLDTIYLTTTQHGLDKEGRAREPMLGGVFRFDAGIRGLAEPRFDEAAGV